MRLVSVTQTGPGLSAPIVLDQYVSPENTGWAAVLNGTATYAVEFSQDDPFAAYATDYNTNGNWTQLTGYTAVTTSKFDNTAYPVKALRINIASGTGSVRFNVNQSGVR